MDKLLYFAPFSEGGLADYAHQQANALAACGLAVVVLCGPRFAENKDHRYLKMPILCEPTPTRANKAVRAWRMASRTLSNYAQLAKTIRGESFQRVLFASYEEYFAPLWSRLLQQLSRQGIVLGAVLHDPVRDTVRGPRWWHRVSVAAAYSFLRDVFVHERIDIDTAGCRLPRLTVVPHGPMKFPETPIKRAEARLRYGLPQDAPVALAFGHIRDSKNLDLVIRALRRVPELHLLVAGREQSGGQRPGEYYQALARECGVADRCHWQVRFIPDSEVHPLFQASDYLLLTYSSTFRSASGVLASAVQFEKPCLASCGAGPLRTAVRDYGLGLWREPDDADAVADGLSELVRRPVHGNWQQYRAENSWEANARRIHESLFAA